MSAQTHRLAKRLESDPAQLGETAQVLEDERERCGSGAAEGVVDGRNGGRGYRVWFAAFASIGPVFRRSHQMAAILLGEKNDCTIG